MLREGKQHCQCDTPDFLRETISLCRQVTNEPLLIRLDSGNHKVHRRRLRTVISNMILMASHVTEHARQLIMGLGQSNVWRHTFAELYTAFAQFSL